MKQLLKLLLLLNKLKEKERDSRVLFYAVNFKIAGKTMESTQSVIS